MLAANRAQLQGLPLDPTSTGRAQRVAATSGTIAAMRLAWFSPLPPVRSGISAYSVDVLDGLRHRHAVDLYVEDRVWHAAGGHLHAGRGAAIVPLAGPWQLPLYRAYDFAVRHDREPYDLIVYQIGNAPCHGFLWPYLLRWPGLVVLHDAAVHHARAQALLADRRAEDYRAEFRFNHPGIDPRVADYVVAGLEGSPYYLWPMLRTVVSRARAVAVHGPTLRAALAEEWPDTPFTTISMGVPDPCDVAGTGHRARDAGHRATGCGHQAEVGALTMSTFGLITPEKRILPILRALAAIRDELPALRLRLVGEIDAHYALWADVAHTGTGDLIEVTGYVSDEELAHELLQADVCLCLRWPTAHETSASWLRCLAAGKATVISDLSSTVDVPSLDPRHWQLKHTEATAATVFQPGDPGRAVAVSVQLDDEEAMLRQALRRLASDASLRAALGRRAREWWQGAHTLPRMQRDYGAAVEWAATQNDPSWTDGVPAHLQPDPSAWARQLVAPFALDGGVDILDAEPP